MSCTLRAIGTLFDVDAFLQTSALVADSVFHRGETRLAGVADGPRRSASGFNVAVSAAGPHRLDAQVDDAIRFLGEHEEELRRLGSFDGVEEVCIEFAVRRSEAAAQSDLFPADLLWRVDALDIDLLVTQYAIAGGAGRMD